MNAPASHELSRGANRWQFGLRQMLIVVSATAVLLALFDWRRWPISSAAICVAVVAAVILLPAKCRISFAVIFGCTYLPYVWLLSGYPWDDYRWGWIGMWPVLPGLLPGAYFFHATHENLESLCMALATLVFVALSTAIGARRESLLVLTALVVLGLSILNSVVARSLFLA